MITLQTIGGKVVHVLQKDGEPTHRDVLRMIADGWPIEIVASNAAERQHVTPAGIVTVYYRP